jgi:hypothetical protein
LCFNISGSAIIIAALSISALISITVGPVTVPPVVVVVRIDLRHVQVYAPEALRALVTSVRRGRVALKLRGFEG